MDNIINEYVCPNGTCPYAEWLGSLKDKIGKARIMLQVDRLEIGNFGDSVPIGAGISELRIHYGPGYRVYYARVTENLYLLLCGGNKASQKQDIKLAKNNWKNYKKEIAR